MTRRLGWAANPNGRFRRGLGVFLVIVGLLIATGMVRNIESWLVDRGWLGAVVVEQGILDSAPTEPSPAVDATEIPGFLKQSFPGTDWSRADPTISKALSGGRPEGRHSCN